MRAVETGDFRTAKLEAASLRKLSDTDFRFLWATFLEKHATVCEALSTGQIDNQLRQNLARAREVLRRIVEITGVERPTILELAISEIDVIEFQVAMQLQVLARSKVNEQLLKDRELRWRAALISHACQILGIDADAAPEWTQPLLRSPVPAVLLRLHQIAEYRSEELRLPHRIEEAIFETMSLYGGRGSLKDAITAMVSDPVRAEAFGQRVAEAFTTWSKLPGSEAIADFLSLRISQVPKATLKAINESRKGAILTACLRGAPLVKEFFDLRNSPADIRVEFFSRVLGFLAEEVYRPLLDALVAIDVAVQDPTRKRDSTLGGARAHARDTWDDPFRAAVLDVELIDIRNACAGHADSQIDRDGTLTIRKRNRSSFSLSPDDVLRKVESTLLLIFALNGVWDWIEAGALPRLEPAHRSGKGEQNMEDGPNSGCTSSPFSA